MEILEEKKNKNIGADIRFAVTLIPVRSSTVTAQFPGQNSLPERVVSVVPAETCSVVGSEATYS